MSKVLDLWAGMTATVLPFAGVAAPTGWLLCDGAAVSRATYPVLFKMLVTDAGFAAQTFTVTIAAPGVFTKTAHGFTGGERLRLTTTGALPTGLTNTADYFVDAINANTFYLRDAATGARITTTGTQSGTHSYIESMHGLGNGITTFNVPDLRGEFIRGADNGRGIDPNRSLGTKQKGTLAPYQDTSDAMIHPYTVRMANTDNPESAFGIDPKHADHGYTGESRYHSQTSHSANTLVGTMRPRNVALNHIIKT